ncbi:Smr/MutS family protein [Methylohalobius crimeensis]|uniref:Smr/MutS family protein n=1 Tax=Methylohalobius crimeensis TaxID=244365 RepID=UPI0003B60595|nr:Smr/MutS family protein [Methylohalobius crimeensis]
MSIDDKDKDLFRRAVAGIRPLSSDQGRASAPRRRRIARSVQRLAEETVEVGEVGFGETISYLRQGHDQRLLKKLRQGNFPPQAELDLHGQTRTHARALLEDFLIECRWRRVRCALIIHGKGWRSDNFQPVLKNFLNQSLPGFPQVIAFCSAKPSHGGTGALYVLFAQNQKK